MEAGRPDWISDKRVCKASRNRHVSSIEEINDSQSIQRRLFHCYVAGDRCYGYDFKLRRS